MFSFTIEKWIPRFILNDKNGYALAKAIEAALKILNDTAEDGLALIDDYDAMPEWRLDELAWEFNCLYDYQADIELKREWIRNALSMHRLMGTPEAIREFLKAYFDDLVLEENWEYGGDPYHFRVLANGAWSESLKARTLAAIERAKNVRSVLDGMNAGERVNMGIESENTAIMRIPYPPCGTLYAGQWP